MSSVPFQWSDAWLLHAVLLAAGERDAALDEVIGAADMLNKAMLTFDELDGGIARLEAAGFVSIVAGRFRLSETGRALYRQLSPGSGRRASEAIRRALGAPEPPGPPYKPGVRDPDWTSGAFTPAEMARAERVYRKRFRSSKQ
jgi:hypothetical protein